MGVLNNDEALPVKKRFDFIRCRSDSYKTVTKPHLALL